MTAWDLAFCRRKGRRARRAGPLAIRGASNNFFGLDNFSQSLGARKSIRQGVKSLVKRPNGRDRP